VSPDRDLGPREDDEREVDRYEDESPRSIFSALWFRALLAILVLGVLAAVAVPYVLDFATVPALKGTASKPAAVTPTSPAITPPAAPPAATAPVAPTVATAAPVSPPPRAPAAVASKPAKAAPELAAVARPPAAVARPAAVVAKAVDERRQAAKATGATRPSPTKAVTVTGGAPYWVQVGAFRDAETARRLVGHLQAQGFRVEESITGPAAPRPSAAPPTEQSSGDRYDVVVSGASSADVDAKLGPKGMTGEITPNGIVVRPSLPLRDAVALSRELADAGLSIQVRRVGGGSAPAAAPGSGEALHRVRVGGFPDRATAVAAMKQLEDKGFKPFIARGNE
jgi:cell division septation protein DedD